MDQKVKIKSKDTDIKEYKVKPKVESKSKAMLDLKKMKDAAAGMKSSKKIT